MPSIIPRILIFVGLCVSGTTVSAVEQFPLGQVRLLDGPFKHAQDLNLEHLLQYDVDRLLAPYLKEAGLSPKAESYPNWLGLDGHIGGHYLSAMAMYVAATGNEECRRRLNYMIDELERCQKANGDGYVGGVPGGSAIWQAVAAGDPRATRRGWVPWYNVHKTYAGLRDAWVYGENPQARSILIQFADWCDTLLSPFTAEQMETMMDQEYGGMNAVLADIAEISGDSKYLELAKRFSHRQLLTPMAEGRDSLDDKHANTQVPKAVGFQRIAELTGDATHARAARFFWETVVTHRSLAFGGNSRREHFPSAGACQEFVQEREGPESCNTYNMLKLTAGLHRMEPEAKYADYYERALFNHILSTQHPDHGGYVYFTPVRPRHYRVYSSPNQGMWCCVGSGMENHVKYGQFIYSHDDAALWINLFIASELDWKAKGVRVRQQTRLPDEPKSVLTVEVDKPARFTLNVRHPAWVPAGQLQLRVGAETWTPDSSPSTYTSIDREWHNGDQIEVSLPMHTTVEALPNVPEYVAILHGPIVLAAKTGTEDLQGLIADDDRWAHIAHGQLLPIAQAPVLIGDVARVAQHVVPANGNNAMQFRIQDIVHPKSFGNLILEPFFRVHDARYMMYWRVLTRDKYEQVLAEAEREEQQRLLLDKQTVDRVIPGEQQPEADHHLQSERSEAGIYRNKHLRHVQAPGWFSYDLRVPADTRLELLVSYWGREGGRRTFDILIDDKVLATENTVNKWNEERFVDVRYPIPADAVLGKQQITVTFRPHKGNMAGGIFDLRLLNVKAE
ncbi:MAG: glycoside hydrolase family 127 protein [Planctomycetales bacterium]|nr:glycoside hydrolase family 127 protein [Planctomycetales bacterium]